MVTIKLSFQANLQKFQEVIIILPTCNNKNEKQSANSSISIIRQLLLTLQKYSSQQPIVLQLREINCNNHYAKKTDKTYDVNIVEQEKKLQIHSTQI